MSRRAIYGDGSVTVKGDGRYQLRWSEGTDPFTGKHRRRTETITAKNLSDARRELKARTSARKKLSRVTFGELLDLTLPQLPIAGVTRETYGYVLKHIPGAARLWVAAEITIMQGRQIIEGLTGRCGAQTVRKIHGALMACWRQATLNGWVDSNPWRGQRLPKITTSAGVVLHDDELERLKAACDPLERVWIDIHLATGARPGEVVELRWSQLDLDQRLIHFIDHKHDDEPRSVAIEPVTVDRIRAWQQAQRQRALATDGVTLAEDPYLISSDPASAEPWLVGYAAKRWRRLREVAGLRPHLRLYDTRHTHNSWLEAAGIDKATRAGRIGNSAATNERVYTHPTRDREAAAAVAAKLT